MKEANRVGVVERVDGEVPRTELSGRQQRAEDEDRLIAALPRLGQRKPLKEAETGVSDTGVRFRAGGTSGP